MSRLGDLDQNLRLSWFNWIVHSIARQMFERILVRFAGHEPRVPSATSCGYKNTVQIHLWPSARYYKLKQNYKTNLPATQVLWSLRTCNFNPDKTFNFDTETWVEMRAKYTCLSSPLPYGRGSFFIHFSYTFLETYAGGNAADNFVFFVYGIFHR